jgi:hypothetical protein
LTEFSELEYSVYGQNFEGETGYDAPGVGFLDRHWKVALATVWGKIYKIAFYFESESTKTVTDVSADVWQYCQQRLGKPSEQREALYIWDTADGNVVLQFAKAGGTYTIHLFETSRAVRTFAPKSGSRPAEWRTVPADPKYWHPINKGFTQTNSKFMCSDCGAQFPLPACSGCGSETSQLGTSMGLPGVFCERCGSGCTSWTCPSCQQIHKTMLVFYFDAGAISVRKKRFWE